MEPALSVTELDDVAQNLDHQEIILLLINDLLRHHAFQNLLLRIEHEHVAHTAQHRLLIKWAADIIGRSQVISVFNITGGRLCRNRNDRNALNPSVSVHNRQNLESIHLRHHDVQKNQRKIGVVLIQQGNCLYAVGRFHNIILDRQYIRQKGAVDLRIIHY